MDKYVLRIVCLFLVPCLTADPQLAAALAAPPAFAHTVLPTRGVCAQHNPFIEQALISHELFWGLPLLVKRTPSPEIKHEIGSERPASLGYLWTGKLNVGLLWMAIEMAIFSQWRHPSTNAYVAAFMITFMVIDIILHALVDTGIIGPRKSAEDPKLSKIFLSTLRFSFIFFLYPFAFLTYLPFIRPSIGRIIPYLVHGSYDFYQMRGALWNAWKNRKALMDAARPDDISGRGGFLTGLPMYIYYAKSAIWQKLLFVGWIPWHYGTWQLLTEIRPWALWIPLWMSFLVFRLALTLRRWRSPRAAEVWQGWRTELERDFLSVSALYSLIFYGAVFLLPISHWFHPKFPYFYQPWLIFAAAVLAQWVRDSFLGIRQGRGKLAVSWAGLRGWGRTLHWPHVTRAAIGSGAVGWGLTLLTNHLEFGILLMAAGLLSVWDSLTRPQPARRHRILTGILAAFLAAAPGYMKLSDAATPFSYKNDVFVPSTQVYSEPAYPSKQDMQAFHRDPKPAIDRFLEQVRAARGQRWTTAMAEERFRLWRISLTVWEFARWDKDAVQDRGPIQDMADRWPALLAALDDLDQIHVDSVRGQLARSSLKVILLYNLANNAGFIEDARFAAAVNKALFRLHDERFVADPLIRRYFPDVNPHDHLIAGLTDVNTVIAQWLIDLAGTSLDPDGHLAAELRAIQPKTLTTEEREDQGLARADFSMDPFARVFEAFLYGEGSYEADLQRLKDAEREAVHRLQVSEVPAVQEFRQMPAEVRTFIRASAERYHLPERLLVNIIEVNSFRKRSQYTIKDGIEIFAQRHVIPDWLSHAALLVLPDVLLFDNLGSAEFQNFLGAAAGGQSALGMGLVRPVWVKRYIAWGAGSQHISSLDFARRMLNPRDDIEATAAVYSGGIEDVKRFRAKARDIDYAQDTRERAELLGEWDAMAAPFAREAKERTRLMETWETARYIPDAAAFQGEDWMLLTFHPQSGYFVGNGPQGPGHLKFDLHDMLQDQRMIIRSGVLGDGKPLEIVGAASVEEEKILEKAEKAGDSELAAAAHRALEVWRRIHAKVSHPPFPKPILQASA